MLVETSLRDTTLSDLPRQARLAEALGFDGIAQPELRHDPFLAVGLLATATTRLRLATGVAIAFPRSPTVVAHLARDLQDLSAGRFALGLGTQVQAHVERRFGVAWSPPGPRLREYLLALRAVWDSWQHGTPLNFQGQHYRLSLMTPAFSPGPSPFGPIPIQTAAVNTYNLRLAGELADGLRVHPFSTPDYVRAVVWPAVQAGAARAGRSLASFDLIGCGFLATGRDAAAVAAAREEVRERVAFYGSTRAYRPVLEHHGWGDLSTRLGRLAALGRWDLLPSAVSDDVLDTFCLAGPYHLLAQRVEARLGGLVDWLQLPLPADPQADRAPLTRLLADLRAIPGRRDRRGPQAAEEAPT